MLSIHSVEISYSMLTLFPLLYALLGSPLAAAGVVCSCVCWHHTPKAQNTYMDNSSLYFYNLQCYSNYFTYYSESVM